MRVRTLIVGILAAALYVSPPGLGAEPIRVRNLDGQLVDPLQVQASRDVRATVLIFVSTECPISNRYAPELQRIAREFGPKGVRFWLVYANPTDSEAAIRAHVKAYGYSIAPLRDPEHDLVRLAKATVTPEVAVFDSQSRLSYRGRIDDRYVSIGVVRPEATRHDLSDALTDLLARKPVRQPTTQAVGCFLADFQP